MEKVRLTPSDGGETVELYVLEETRVAGEDYLLATDLEDGDGEAYILRDTSKDGDTEAVYEFVEDDEQLAALSEVFSEMLEDVDLV